MNKNFLLAGLLTHLENELLVLKSAANNAKAASIDEQSIAETQYDTLAIEAGYLAEGQAKRAQEIELEVRQLKQLSLTTYHHNTPIDIGALVQLNHETEGKKWFFIAPVGAGFRINIEQCTVTVITPKSPLGKAIIEKQVGDEIELPMSRNSMPAEIISVL